MFLVGDALCCRCVVVDVVGSVVVVGVGWDCDVGVVGLWWEWGVWV